MGSFLDQLFGLSRRPNPRELLDHARLDLAILTRMWSDDDKDSTCVMAFVRSMSSWYDYMEDSIEDNGTLVNRNIHDAIGSWMEGYQQSMDEFYKLGRLRCDAIEASTGTSPFSVAEEDEMRNELARKHAPEARGDQPVPGDANWVREAESTG